MDPQLFSETLAIYEGEITNLLLIRSIRQLADFYEVGQLRIWDEHRIAIPVLIPVELPPLGNFDGLDIRSKEPILLVVHRDNYPTTAPASYPDRLDFPKDQLAHLYIAREGRPPQLCLIRGSITGLSEWYANKQMKDLATRISNWFRDAAAGTLTENAGQWEPLRLQGYNGALTYDYDAVAKIVNENASFEPGQNYAIFRCEWFEGPDEHLNCTLYEALTPETIEKHHKDVWEEVKKEEAPTKRRLDFGYLFWSPVQTTYSGYHIDLPRTWEQFKEFCDTYGVNAAVLERELTTTSKNAYIITPVVIAIRRPRQLIGYSGSLEFLNFHIRVGEDQVTEGKINDLAIVKFKDHIQPLTLTKAKELSGFSDEHLRYLAVIGCGALGARIALHFAKSGVPPMIVSDPDTFSVHNFLRHPLSAINAGRNKAYSLAKEIKSIYSHTADRVIPASDPGKEVIVRLSPKGTFAFPWLFDFTASPSFQNQLVGLNILTETRIVKGYITDFGNLGVLFFEGEGQNPRIDDLQVLLYAKSIDHDLVSNWLQREGNAPGNASFINIGIGCNTETTVLSNDVVDLHAALMTGNIKIEATRAGSSVGKVQLHAIESTPIFHTTSLQWEINPLSVYTAIENPTWQVRFANGIIGRMQEQMRAAAPRETGGVFVGCANYKTNTIHVVDLIDAPPDSQADEVCFIRGIDGLPDKVRQINERSGGQLGYIGEWHSHPQGPEGMSVTDRATVQRFRAAYRQLTTSLPVFLTIVTLNKVLPFVIE